MRKRIFWVGVICLILAACRPALVPPEIQNSFPIEQPFDKVWQAVIETFAEMNLPIMNMEKVSGFIATDWIVFDEGTGYCLCGDPDFIVDRLGKFNVYVKKIGDNSCEIKVYSIFESTASYPLETRKQPCFSTGKLERDIYDLVITKTK